MMANPTRVLNIAETASMGGINTFSVVTAPEFARVSDIEVIYAALSSQSSGWFFDRMQQLGFDVNWIPCIRPPDFGVLWRIRDVVEKNHIDVIQTNGPRGNFYVRAMLDMGLINLPTIIIKHGLPPTKSFINRLYSWADRRPTRKASRVIAVDQYTFNSLARDWKVSEHRLRLVHNPASDFVQPPVAVINEIVHKLGLKKGIPIILFLGRIEREKGIYELLQAHKKMCDGGEYFYLLIVGDGVAREDVVSFSQTNSSGKYIRWVPSQLDVTPYFALCSVFVLPSYSEGLPFSLLEAMSAGKPVIASCVGGIQEVVINHLYGILLEPRQRDALVHSISLMLSDPNGAREMGKRGREFVLSQFSILRTIDQLSELYRLAATEFSSCYFHHNINKLL